MRTVHEPARPLTLPRKTATRRRRLHRGARRFWRDVQNDGRRYHRVMLFALTVADLDTEPLRGAIRYLEQQLRKLSPGLRYFWWPEFQARGALHYHGILIDPAFQLEREARHWLQVHWPHAGIQPWLAFKSAAWFRDNQADYVLKEVGKGHRKGYEQWYEEMPTGWRTFGSHHLKFPAEVHVEHEDRGYVDVKPDGTQLLVATDEHTPSRDGCILRPDRRAIARRGLWKLFGRKVKADARTARDLAESDLKRARQRTQRTQARERASPSLTPPGP